MTHEFVATLLLTYLPIVISIAALAVSIVAIRQRRKERRIKYAEEARSAALQFIRKVYSNPHLQDSDLNDFNESTRDLKLYFGRGLRRYIDSLHANGCRIRLLNHRIDSSRSSQIDRESSLEELERLLQWFEDQVDEVNKRFRKCL